MFLVNQNSNLKEFSFLMGALSIFPNHPECAYRTPKNGINISWKVILVTNLLINVGLTNEFLSLSPEIGILYLWKRAFVS